MPDAIPDTVIVIASVTVAVAGLLLLWFAAPETTSQQYVLNATVISVHGRFAQVNATVTVIGKNLTRGSYIEQPVFWNGAAFVVTQ